jgi:MYXO-CTERM domain-containing protein
MRISKLAGLACGVAFLLAGRAALADIAIDDDGVTVNFTDFTAAGFSATPSTGQLSSNDWSITGFSDGDLNFGSTNTAPDYKRGVPAGMLGMLNEGGIYAFSSSANVMFGVLQSAEDFTTGTITARFKSSVVHPIVKLAVSYKIMTYNKGARSDSLNFAWSTDNVTYTAVGALDYASPGTADATAAWTTTNRSTTLTANIPVNGFLYLRWTGSDGGTGTTYDLLGLDDITVTPQNGCGDGVAAGGESCDDGNSSNADLCLNTCEQASCGDGYIRTTGTPEQCDPGIQGTQCCSSCLKTNGNACTASGNRPGTCNVGTCVANPVTGSGGEGGEMSAGGAGGESNGGEMNGGGGSGGTGRGGRGPRAGAGGQAGTGTAGTGTAGTDTAGTAGTGTAGSTTQGGTSGGGAPSGGKGGAGATGGTAGATGGSAGATGGTSGGKAGKGGTGGTKPPASGSDDDGGCGCSVPRSSSHASLAFVMMGALAAFARRRRRS